MTGNQGEKRESLNILEKVGMYEGLLDKICTDKMVRMTLIVNIIHYDLKFLCVLKPILDWHRWR